MWRIMISMIKHLRCVCCLRADQQTYATGWMKQLSWAGLWAGQAFGVWQSHSLQWLCGTLRGSSKCWSSIRSARQGQTSSTYHQVEKHKYMPKMYEHLWTGGPWQASVEFPSSVMWCMSFLLLPVFLDVGDWATPT